MAVMTSAEFAAAAAELIRQLIATEIDATAFAVGWQALYEVNALSTDSLALRTGQLVDYFKERMLFGPVSSTPTAASVDLGILGSHLVELTGSVPIEDFGDSATLANPVFFVTSRDGVTLLAGANMLTPGGNDLLIPEDYSAAVRYDGDGVWRVMWYAGEPGPIGPAADKQFLPGSVTGAARNAETIYRIELTRTLVLDDSLCKASCAAAASVGQVWTLYRNGVSVATVTFAGGSTVGVIAISTHNLTAPCVLSLVAPTTVDSAQQDTSITFAGSIP